MKEAYSVFRIQNSLGFLSTAILDQNHHDVWESLLLCPQEEMRARTKLSYGRTASHHNSRYSYFSTFWFVLSFFFLACWCESTCKGKNVIQKYLTLWCLYEPEKFTVSGQRAHSWAFTLRNLYKFTLYDVSSSNILYPFLSYPSLTLSNTHGPSTAPLQKFASRVPAKPGLGSVPQNSLRTDPSVAVISPQVTTLTAILLCYEVRLRALCAALHSLQAERADHAGSFQ